MSASNQRFLPLADRGWRRLLAPLLGALLLATTAAGCGASSVAAPPSVVSADASSGATAGDGTPSADLTIFAAASLRAVLEAARTAYGSTHPGVAITLSTDSSTALETQIEQGAPADLFLSADTRNPQRLADAGLAAGPPFPFARNALAVVVPAGNPAGIATPADLARPGVRIVAAGDAVPITTYATSLVGKLATRPGYPPDFAARYAANVVSREDNVTAVLAKVELGEADAGIVYATDARGTTGVRTVPIPDGANVAATYAGVVVRGAPNETAAKAFAGWLVGAEGRAILEAAGFDPPGP